MSVLPAETSAPAPGLAPARLANLWHLFLLTLVVLLVGLPMTFLVIGSFSTSHLPTDLSLSPQPSASVLPLRWRGWWNARTFPARLGFTPASP